MGGVAGARLPTIGARGIAASYRVSKPAVFTMETQGGSKELSHDHIAGRITDRAVRRGLADRPGACIAARKQSTCGANRPCTGGCACANLALRTSQRFVLDRTRPAT